MRLAKVHGDATIQTQAGELRGSEIDGPLDIDTNATDITLEQLAKANGPIRVTAVAGSIRMRGVASDVRIDSRNAEVEVVMDKAAPLAIYNEGNDPITLTPPSNGYQLDLLATTGGRIKLPDGTLEVKNEPVRTARARRSPRRRSRPSRSARTAATSSFVHLTRQRHTTERPHSADALTRGVAQRSRVAIVLTHLASICKLTFFREAIVISTAPLLETSLEGLTLHRRGKVRDVYEIGDALLIVATDRISAFDYVLGSGIPDKGKVLTQLSAFWFERMGDLVPHHLISMDPVDVSGTGAPPRRPPARTLDAGPADQSGSGRMRRTRLPVRVGLEGVPADRRGLRREPAGGPARVRSAARTDLHAGDEGRERARHQHQRRTRRSSDRQRVSPRG